MAAIAFAQGATVDSARQSGGAVHVRGTVTAFSGWKNSFFLQDQTGAISVDRLENADVAPGDEVQIDGTVQPRRFAPVLISKSLHVIGHAEMPEPYAATYDALATGQFDSRFVELHGTVRSAVMSEVWGRRVGLIRLNLPSGTVNVHVINAKPDEIADLVDRDVRVRGVCGTIFNAQQQLIGIRLFVNSIAGIEPQSPARPIDAAAAAPLRSLLRFDGPSRLHRVKTSGTVTYQANSHSVYLQEGDAAIRVQTEEEGWWPVGSRVFATGFATTSGLMPVLQDAEISLAAAGSAPAPIVVDPENAIRVEDGFRFAPFNGRLVQVRGRIVEPGSSNGVSILRSGRTEFEAQTPVNGGSRAVVDTGTEVAVTGIFLASVDDDGNPSSFRILMRSPDDMQTIGAPYWTASIMLLLTIVGLVLLGSLILWILHRRTQAPASASTGREVLAHNIGAILAAASGALALAVISGWIWDVPALQIGYAHVPMMPNTAAGFVAISAAVLMIRSRYTQWRRLSACCALLPLVIGSLTLVEHGTDFDLHIDRLFVGNALRLAGFLQPGRMAIASALCLVLTGLAAQFVRRRQVAGIGQVLGLAACIVCFVNFAGLVFASQSRFSAGAHATMSLPSAGLFIVLNLALLLSSAEWGFMSAFLSNEAGGVMARRMLPAAFLGPLLLGWIRLQGQVAGWYDTRFGIALFACSGAVFVGFLVWSCADVLNGLGSERSGLVARLKERDQHLEQVFQYAGVGDFSWDAKQDQLTAHEVVWQLYGSPDHHGAESAGWFQARQHPDDLIRVEREMLHAKNGSRYLDTELRVAQPDGSWRWICCRAQLLCDASGQLERVIGVNFDVTRSKQAEAALESLNSELERRVEERSTELRLSEQRHRLMIEGVADYSIIMLDAQGYINSWNAGAERIKQYTAEEIIGRHFSVFYPADRVAAKHPQYELDKAMADGRYREEGWRVRKDGSQFWASVLLTRILGPDGKVCGFSKVVRDMTEQRKAEETIRAEQRRAEEANRAKSAFVASMSHEIRTPMNAILGMAELLSETALSERQKNFVSVLQRASANLLLLINDILDLSKIEAGKIELETIPFQPRDIVARSLDLVRAKADSKGLHLDANVAVNVPQALAGDPVRLQQILVNLLSNAVKFTHAGSVRVTVRSAADSPSDLHFEVTDTGIGIPGSKLSAIFEDFTQVDASTTREYGGTGLGLGIVKRLVMLMGGAIAVCSEAGKGSTFRFTARFGASSQISDQAGVLPEIPSSQQRPLRLLVAEDCEDNRFLLEEYLSATQHQLVFADNGEHAVQLYKNDGAFDLVLMDMQMPIMDGLQATREIRALEQALNRHHIPIIALSANAMTSDREASEQAGCDSYLTKPITKQRLLQALHT